MHILAAINNNINEWKALQQYSTVKPRLPLPYAFGGAFLNAGHKLSALDLTSKSKKEEINPFNNLYHKYELSNALRSVDIATLWGSDALKAIFQQAISSKYKNNIVYFTYVFSPEKPNKKQRMLDMATRLIARSTKGIVVMTGTHESSAKQRLGDNVPIIRMRCGIDTAFYRENVKNQDIPEHERYRVEKLLSEPYVIMPGDELRFNDDAINFVENSGIRLVRVSQYGYKSGTEKLKKEVEERGLEDRLLIFEKISYPFLRFLLANASAYAGLVDSSWQPAGWTVACEALSSGLPMVIYEGLTSREMNESTAPQELVQSVNMGDITTFTDKLISLVTEVNRDKEKIANQASKFAEDNLDFNITAPPFVREIEKLVATN